jgi:type I restriction enzyme S subunit
MVPYLRAANITWDGLGLDDVKEMDFTAAEQETYRLKHGDVLLSEASGSASEVGKPAIWRDEIPSACFQNTLIRVRSRGPVPEYLCYHFLCDARLGRFASAGKGVGINHLGADRMSGWKLALPPLDEQRRIVAKLEDLLARGRRTKEALDTIPTLLERLRQAVLAAAFRGDLTQDWREKNPDVEPASQLLDRIRSERRRRWEEAELERMRAKGKPPKDERWKERYEEPLEAESPPPLQGAEGWAWTTLDAVTLIKGGLALGKKREKGERLVERPYLRVANVQRGRLDLSEVKAVAVTADEARDLALLPGDVLFNEGGDRDKLGRGWIWSGEVPNCIHQNHVFRGRPVTTEIQPKLLSWFGNTFGQRYFLDEAKQTTNLASVSMTKLRRLPVPVMPSEEQKLLVSRIEDLLGRVAVLEVAHREAASRLSLLEQAALAKAFRGELVPQDPADEPASVLLERIKAEREGAGPTDRDQPKRGRRKVA